MRLAWISIALLLTGCAGPQSALEPPIVDKRGVDPAKYANDEAECIEKGRGFVTVGAPITACMRERGYTILVPKA